jgi:hypothetical protein
MPSGYVSDINSRAYSGKRCSVIASLQYKSTRGTAYVSRYMDETGSPSAMQQLIDQLIELIDPTSQHMLHPEGVMAKLRDTGMCSS